MGGKFSKEIYIHNNSNLNSDVNIENLSLEETDSKNNTIRNKIRLKSLEKTGKIILTEQNDMNELSSMKILREKNRGFEDSDLIDLSLAKHFFIGNIEKESRTEIIREMSKAYIPANVTIFKQGDRGKFFYVIKSGEVLVENKSFSKIIGKGDSFGELALLHESPRSASCKTLTDSFFYILDRKIFRKITEHINYINFEMNKKFIHSVIILDFIDNEQKSILYNNILRNLFCEGDYIVREGDKANCLYIIKDGEVDCVQNGVCIRTLKKGDYFGEKALILEQEREMDVIARTKCIIYAISIETLKKMVGDQYINILFLNFIKYSFKNSKYFNCFETNLIEKIYDSFKAYNLGKNRIAFSQGFNKSKKLIILIEGNLLNSNNKEIIFKRGDILFEEELINKSDNKLDYDLIADPDCLYAEAEIDDISNILGGHISELMNKYTVYEAIKKIHIFKNISATKLEILSKKLNLENYNDKQSIITEGEEGSRFYIVNKGKVDILIKGNYLRTLNEYEYFGERALFFKEKRSATAIANGPVEIYYLDKDDFVSIIDNNMKDYLTNRLYLQDNTIQLEDLDYIQQLGSGSYGSVYLVQAKKNKFLYAIKCISKKQIDSEQLHRNIDLEKSILLKIDHPFIVKLVKTLKDKDYIYFLMEYIKGKELFDVIREIGLLNKYQTQFYAASLMLAVKYLHSRKCIYRDIKPENVLVLSNGYIKIIDFGTAKEIIDRTTTIIGTPHYMAPEVILGEGYTFSVDFWSIACCMYEFICGAVPFGESADDPMDVYVSIVNDQLDFPKFIKDKEFKILMLSMMEKNLISRLLKLSQIKNNIWFNGFDWEGLINMNTEPAYKPKSDSNINKKSIIPFVDFMKNKHIPWSDKNISEVKPTAEDLEEFEKWFNNF